MGILNNVHTIFVGNFAVLGKFIYSVLEYIRISFINKIKAGKSIGVFFYSRYFGFSNIRAFTLFGEGDITGLLCLATCGQAVSNLHIAGQVLLTICKITIGQLACQRVQHVCYVSVAVHADASVVGDQRYYRAFCCVLDNGVACFVVLSRFAISFMRVEDVGIAAVVVDSQAIIILLEDVACFCFALAAGKVGYTAACPFFAAPRILDNRINYFVVPGCAVLQPQVCITGKGLVTGFLASFGKAVLYDTGQAGFSS